MAGYVGHLAAGEQLKTGEYFKGPWRSFERVVIQPAGGRDFNALDSEYAVYVMSGTGEASVAGKARAATPGSSFTVGYGARLQVTAGDEPIELFVTALDVSI